MVCDLRVRCGSTALLLVIEVMTPLARATSAVADTSQESSLSEDRSEQVRDLRRQLMQNNSDYSHELQDTASTEPLQVRARPLLDTTGSSPVTEMPSMDQLSEERGDIPGSSQPVSQRDLLYYVDDERLVNRPADQPRFEPLKLRRGFRRGGQGQYLRQQGAEGVSIVSLHRAPFPDLRLPPSRSQYRLQQGQVVSEEQEVPPPPVPREELQTAGDERTESLVSSSASEVEGRQFSTAVM